MRQRVEHISTQYSGVDWLSIRAHREILKTGGSKVNIVSIRKLSNWLWDVTVPIRHETEAQLFLDGMEQTRTVAPHRKSTEVVFSVFFSDRCEDQDLIDAENTILGMANLLEGSEKRERGQTNESP